MLNWLTPPPVFIEIGPDWLLARRSQQSLELALECGADGRPQPAAKAKAIEALKSFLGLKSWQPRPRAWCAISARGVALRRLTLPAGSKEETHQRLRLQIEAEFPLPPEELAWGCQLLGAPPSSNGSGATTQFLIAAVRKEWLADFQEILHSAGTDPVFTLASQARWKACGPPSGDFAMLHVRGRQSELTLFESALPTATRLVHWEANEVAHPTAESLATLAKSLQASLSGTSLWVTGPGIPREFAERLAASLNFGCRCELAAAAPGEAQFTAIAGLEKYAAQGAGPDLAIQLAPAAGTGTSAAVVDWKTLGTRVGALAAACLLLPYFEAVLLRPHLQKKVAAFKAEAARLQVIDRELEFLRGLKLSQPPYLDLVYLFSQSVPPGTHFDSLSLNSHGEMTLRAALRDGQQVAEFRNKLTSSGFFTNVVVQEQTPTPDRQHVNVRMSGQEKAPADLQFASARQAQAEAKQKTATSATNDVPGHPPVTPGARKEPQ